MEDDRLLRELLVAILRRLREPIEVEITVHVINEANPAVKVVLEPQAPEPNQKEAP